MVLARNTRNAILSQLSDADFRLLEPNLDAVDLPLRKTLERCQRKIDYIYFPDSGFASVVAIGTCKTSIEVGIIGREGMTGIAVVLGHDRAENETYIQYAGQGRRIKTTALRQALSQSESLHRASLFFVNSFLNQTTKTALANGCSNIEQRLARWLLLADDRIDGGELAMTHEFLALMLGVMRPGVTVALLELERRGLIARRRGFIVILDRNTMEEMSNGTYH
jgi:CRP-like cAMP-binding protein